jgi:hypothetical protein
MVVSAGWDNTVQIWDIRVGGAVRMFYGPHICGEAVDMCGKSSKILARRIPIYFLHVYSFLLFTFYHHE